MPASIPSLPIAIIFTADMFAVSKRVVNIIDREIRYILRFWILGIYLRIR